MSIDHASTVRATAALGDPARPRPTMADELVLFLVYQPTAIRRIRVAHEPRPDGRCRVCTTGGPSRVATVWPCAIRQAADKARDAQLASETGT